RRRAGAARGGVRAVRLLVAVVVLVASGAWAAPLQRVFVMGDGTLAVVNAHTGERAEVRYRRADGTYDAAASARIRRACRCGAGAVLGAEHVAGGGEFVGGEREVVRADGVRSVCEGGGDRGGVACDGGGAGEGGAGGEVGCGEG